VANPKEYNCGLQSVNKLTSAMREGFLAEINRLVGGMPNYQIPTS
jgi:hypothetical protein